MKPFWYGNLIVTKQLDSTIAITKHPYLHGKAQNYKSIDCHCSNSPQLELHFDIPYKVLGTSGTGQDRSIRIGFIGYKLELLIVHAYELRRGVIKSAWHHFHISAKIGNTYYDVTEFFDRNTCKMNVPYWTNIQRDMNGNIISQNYEMVKLQKSMIIKVIKDGNVRSSQEVTPNNDVGDVKAGESWGIDEIAKGQNISGIDTWYPHPKGWVWGGLIEEQRNIQCEKDLAVATAKMAELEKRIEDTIRECKEEIRALEAQILSDKVLITKLEEENKELRQELLEAEKNAIKKLIEKFLNLIKRK